MGLKFETLRVQPARHSIESIIVVVCRSGRLCSKNVYIPSFRFTMTNERMNECDRIIVVCLLVLKTTDCLYCCKQVRVAASFRLPLVRVACILGSPRNC